MIFTHFKPKIFITNVSLYLTVTLVIYKLVKRNYSQLTYVHNNKLSTHT